MIYASTVDYVVDETDILAWSNDTDTDPRGLAVLSDNRLVFFEDESGQDHIVLIDPTENGTDRFSTIATKTQLKAAAPQSIWNIFVGDLVVDSSDNVYAIVCGNKQSIYDNYVVRIPYSNGSFGTPERVVDIYDGGMTSYKTWHRLAIHNNTLFILYDDTSDPTKDHALTSGSNGVYTFDLTQQQPGVVGDLSFLAPYKTLGETLNPSFQSGDAFGLWQIRANSSGDLLAMAYENGSGTPSDLVKIDGGTGAAEVLLTQEQAESETGTLNQFTQKTNLAINPNNDHIILMENGLTTHYRAIIWEFDENGKYVNQLAALPQIVEAAPQVYEMLTTIDSNSLTVNDNGDVFVFLTHENEETLIEIDVDGSCSAIDWGWPTSNTQNPDIASPYGPRQLTSDNFRHDFHRGVDITMAQGTNILAAADGVVTKVSTSGSETTIGIRHGECPPYVYSYYLHMSTSNVSVDDEVFKGDLIGTSGASSSGYEHLHFETRVGGIYQSQCRNPLEYMSYTNVAPTTPTLVGANSDLNGSAFYFTFTTPDTQFDLNAIEASWGSDTVRTVWPDKNKANGPVLPERMDQPVTPFQNQIFGITFPDHTNQASTSATYGFAVGGLDVNGVSGSAIVEDIHGTQASTTLSLNLPDLTATPAQDTTTSAQGNQENLSWTLKNTGNVLLSVSLTVTSANNNTITMDPGDLSFSLNPGASRIVEATVTLNANHPTGTGDGILLQVDAGGSLKVVALHQFDTN